MPTTVFNGLRQLSAQLSSDSTSDGELLARFLAHRDEAAFSALVQRHAAMVFGTCRRILGNVPDADDAFQATFVVLFRKAHSLSDRRCVGNYLYGIAFHTALKVKAMAVTRRLKETRAERPEPTPDQSELLAALDEELARLPEKYRAGGPVRTRRAVPPGGGDGLGVPQGTISSRLATAHRTLEKRLRGAGVHGRVRRGPARGGACGRRLGRHGGSARRGTQGGARSDERGFSTRYGGHEDAAPAQDRYRTRGDRADRPCCGNRDRVSPRDDVPEKGPITPPATRRASRSRQLRSPRRFRRRRSRRGRRSSARLYGLEDGELVRRVAPPYPECRAEYFRDRIRECYKRERLDPPADEELNRTTPTTSPSSGGRTAGRWMTSRCRIPRSSPTRE